MRALPLFAAILLCLAGPALADPAPNAAAFKTTARFSVGDQALALSTAIATIEPVRGQSGYSWLRVNFYSFAPDAEDIAQAARGSVASMDRRWNKLAATPAAYNVGNAVLQLSVDQAGQLWQVDLAVPGHTCTIAPSEKDLKIFRRDYRFAGGTLHLKSKGSFTCDMKFMNLPDQVFTWDVDLDVPVFAKLP